MAIENVKCPICDGPMASRANKGTGQRFWGCKAYPKCRGTRNTDGDVSVGRHAREAEDDNSQLPSDRLRGNDRQRWRS